jgi:hypothetical protein
VRVAYKGGFSAPVLPDPSEDLGGAESPPPPSWPVEEGVDGTGYEEMEAYRGEPWFRDPYAHWRPASRPDPEMEAYRREPWFRDPYAQQPPEYESHAEVEANPGAPRVRDTYVRRPPEYEPDPWYQRYRPARSYGHEPGSRAGQRGRLVHTLRGMLVGAILGGAAVAAAGLLVLDRPGVLTTVDSSVVTLSDHLGRLSNGVLDALWSNLPI